MTEFFAKLIKDRRDHYKAESHSVFEQRHRDMVTSIAVRRVRPYGIAEDEQAQIEISILKRNKKRNTEMSDSLILKPEHVDALIAALQTLR